MSLFGQVWVWSLAAFLIGVLLTWILLVRPAQARSRALERRLEAAQASSSERQSMMNTAATRFAEAPAREPAAAPATTYVAPVGEHEHEPEPSWLDRSSFGGRAPDLGSRAADFSARATEPDEAPAEETSIFAAFQKAAEPESGADDEAEQRGALFVSEPQSISDGDSARGSLFGDQPDAERGSLPGFLFEPEEEPAQDPPAYAFGGGEHASEVEPEQAAETTAILPQRQPRSTPPESFEPPPRPSMRAIERREPLADEGGRSGSLFEPSVLPNTGGAHAAPDPVAATPPPPPARTPPPRDDVPPGPFGPGSAMPRPGGGRPSDAYAVKASVTALRYCTEDSPQFDRMVAEVWFRSVGDAERVGFRPLSQ